MAQNEAGGAQTHGAEPQDAAAEAFEALRAEVAQLRRALEGLPTSAPDYSPTLAAIAQSLATMQAHPALRISPVALSAQLRQVTQAAHEQGVRDQSAILQSLRRACQDLEHLGWGIRDAKTVSRQLLVMGVAGACLGIVVWLGFSGPVARALPAEWGVPENMAAATLGVDPWAAGRRLMQSADPVSWARVIEVETLERGNRSVLEACRKKVIAARQARRCTIILEP